LKHTEDSTKQLSRQELLDALLGWIEDNAQGDAFERSQGHGALKELDDLMRQARNLPELTITDADIEIIQAMREHPRLTNFQVGFRENFVYLFAMSTPVASQGTYTDQYRAYGDTLGATLTRFSGGLPEHLAARDAEPKPCPACGGKCNE
jgi:hypothetical protein